jgi:hypothetical protein
MTRRYTCVWHFIGGGGKKEHNFDRRFPGFWRLSFRFQQRESEDMRLKEVASDRGPRDFGYYYHYYYSWSWTLLEEPPILQLLKNFPALYGTRRFITMFTRAPHWSLSWATSIQYITIPSYTLKIHFDIVHPSLTWSPQWSLSFWLSHQYLICVPFRLHSFYILCPSHPPWLDHSNYTWRRV